MTDFLWRCGRPGCEYTARGGEATNFTAVAAYHDSLIHPEEPQRFEYYPALEEIPDGHPEFSPGAYEYRPEDEADGSGYATLHRDPFGGNVSYWIFDDPRPHDRLRPPSPDDEVRCGNHWLALALALGVAGWAGIAVVVIRWRKRPRRKQ